MLLGRQGCVVYTRRIFTSADISTQSSHPQILPRFSCSEENQLPLTTTLPQSEVSPAKRAPLEGIDTTENPDATVSAIHPDKSEPKDDLTIMEEHKLHVLREPNVTDDQAKILQVKNTELNQRVLDLEDTARTHVEDMESTRLESEAQAAEIVALQAENTKLRDEMNRIRPVLARPIGECQC